MRYKISPSRIGDYFVHNCDRYMVYDGLSNHDRKMIGWDEDKDFNMVAKQAGEAWETEVLCKLEERGEYVAMVPGDDMSLSKADREALAAHRRDETIRFLREAKPGYIYQAVLYINDSFCNEYMSKVDRSQIIWNDSMSDLVRVEYDEERACPKFSVIDMKHAKRAKINHKVQIVVYIRMLKAILKEHDIPGYVDETTGYVWPFKADDPKSFSTGDISTFVDSYFNAALPEVIEKMRGIEDELTGTDIGAKLDECLPYCLSQNCEWCGNLEHCTKWAKEHEPVLLMPYMTPRTQEMFRKNPEIPRTLDEFEEYISDLDNSDRLKEESGFLKNRLGYMSDVISALRDRTIGNRNTAYPKPVFNMEMPKYQDISIIITSQKDVGLGEVYLYGVSINIVKGKNHINLSENEAGFAEEEKIFIAKNPEEIHSNTKEFVEYLYDIFKRIHEYNCLCQSMNEFLSVQGYVMDNYESYNLEEVLFAELLDDMIDTEYRNKLLAIIFWLQGERMITDSAIQGEDIGDEFPLVVLSSIIGRLYVIPGFISNNFEDISKAFSQQYDNEKGKKYSSPLSNAIKSEPINDIWHGKTNDDPEKKDEIKSTRIEKLSNYILKRLYIERRIIGEIQGKDSRHSGIKRAAAPFALVTINESMDDRIAKLYIEQKYEQLLSFHDTKRVRMGDLGEAASDGKILKVRVISETYQSESMVCFPGGRPKKLDGCYCEYEVINKDSFFQDPWFAAIVAETNDIAADELARLNEKKSLYIPDIPEEGSGYHQNFFHTAYFDNMEFCYEGGRMIIKGQRMGGTEYKPGTELYLVERFTDIVGDKTVQKLIRGISNPLILYPEGQHPDESGHMVDNYGGYQEKSSDLRLEQYKERVEKYARVDGMTFSPSQRRAFKQFFEKNVTLLLGPPGSGKTDFIARAVIALAGFFKERYNYNMSILVTANSHAAINNILEKLDEKIQANVSSEDCFEKDYLPQIVKLDKYDQDKKESPIPGIKVYERWYPYGVNEETGRRFLDMNPSVPVLPKLLEIFETRKADGILYEYDIDRPLVVGATSNACQYTRDRMEGDRFHPYSYPGFDIVIIDEASQVKTSDALITMDWSNRSTRFMIVGDENQLSPIIKGKYEAPEDTPDIYGSIFRTFYNIAERCDMDYLCQLEENFRMNEILDRYPGEKIYDVDILAGTASKDRNGYHAYTDEIIGDKIKNQKLTLINEDEIKTKENLLDDDLMRKVLDPEYPLILIKLSGGKAAEKQSLEIRLATEITRLLKEHMVDKDLNPYLTEGEFWGDSNHKGAFAIISPHHEHINRLKDQISEELGMDRDSLYIGTVDKLQGQEREAVVVSYGISNIEKALSEIEFIYSRNRLNVSITRGKKKTIVILTDVLLDKPIELLDVDDESIEQGISFMCDFDKFMRKTETDTVIDHDTKVDEGTGISIEIMRKKVSD